MLKSIDPFRINGPIPSVKPFSDEKLSVLEKLWNEKSGLRSDKRANLDSRPVKAVCGVLGNASGSCYMEIGKTKVIVAVHGPRPPTELKFQFGHSSTRASFQPNVDTEADDFATDLDVCPGMLKCHVIVAPFANAKAHKSFRRDQSEMELAQKIQQALHPAVRLGVYPKALIDIYVTVLEYDGILSGHSAAITASSIALVDAGIEMFDVVIGISGGFYVNPKLENSKNEAKSKPRKAPSAQFQFVVDVSKQEEDLLVVPDHGIVFGVMPNLEQLTFLQETGKIDYPTVVETLDTLNGQLVQQIFAAVKPVLRTIAARSLKSI